MFAISRHASIIHADVDAFFAAVEQRDDPAIRGRPVVVGAGVVMAASYEARAFGIRGGMGGGEASRRCPDLIAVPPRFEAYTAASREVFAIFREAAPVVEGLSLEEAFLDVAGLERIGGTPRQIAERLRRDVLRAAGLRISVGIASTKVIAKMASREAKPDGLLEIPPGRERDFLHPLAVDRIWGVRALDRRAAARPRRGDGRRPRRAPARAPVPVFGESGGRRLHALAHLRELRPVRRGRGRRSFGAQSALGRRERTPEELDRILARLVERVTGRMRRKGRAGRTVVLRLRFGDFSRATRSLTMPRATAATDAVLRAARRLLAAARPAIDERGITLLGIALTNLDPRGTGVQLELPFTDAPDDSLDEAIDDLRERFGTEAVTRGA